MNKINMTQKYMLPWQQNCRVYPIQVHIVLFNIFCLQCNSIFFFFFQHFDCQVLDDNVDKLSLKKKIRFHGSKIVSFIEIICSFD